MLYIAALLPVFLFLATEGAVTTTQSPVDCHAHAVAVCNKTQLHLNYCGNDGKIYHDVCTLMHALCENHNLRPNYTNPACRVAHVTTTAKPLTPFEQALFSAIEHGIDDRLQKTKELGISSAQAKPIFSVQDHTHKHYVRNPKCWAYDLDLTSISPWNSNLRNRKAGTLISPRHAVWARHYSIATNSTLRFVTRDGTVVDRRVAASRAVNGKGGHGFYGRDIVVGVLDQDVPDTISFAKVMPHQIMKMYPPHDVHLPVLSTDQEEKALVADFFIFNNKSISLRTPGTSSLHHDFYESKISGDSGNPSFFVLHDQLVLLFTFTTGGAGGGTNLLYYHDEINQIMTQLGGGYQLTEIDLGSFLQGNQAVPALVG
ncbi:uncharacterized protein [Littorina saxatilis]|uniref:Kazal-like domain-containing protein n=2 Tax=Littorina saxatilis TaxID=31220 RepID=A0AAN9C1N2_9CAEN